MTDPQPKNCISFIPEGVTKSNEIHFNILYNHSLEMFENDTSMCQFIFLLQAKKKYFISLASAAQLTDVNSQNLATMISHSFNTYNIFT
jgi:hypothetical protein